ncbi:acetyltransferase, putative [Plasmodium gallinaceum]|uniref:Acetyltransferase, putative n=1 Tax=Plasmodium gallinaceum TaxID=5849 RepID=A0A1J1GLT5_PLAGA|nr:acetyltransferase, putative [Plasmodium gallinaceum]CRG93374.1 acetyltransferase, putative [Plasmodium gallinaceum]
MNREITSVDESVNEKIENCGSSFFLNRTDIVLENTYDQSKENTHEQFNNTIKKSTIYQTVIFNKKKIEVYQFKEFPKKYLNSVYELLSEELSEPYSIFLLKTILKNYSEIALMSLYDEKCVGTVISKISSKYKNDDEPISFGYICMIAVHKSIKGCGSYLLNENIKLMQSLYGVNEVHLEAEATNNPTLRFYEKNGFIRVKRKPYYYLNGVDAFKLKKKL